MIWGIWAREYDGANNWDDGGDCWDGTTRSGRAGGCCIDGGPKSSQIDLRDNGASKLDGADGDCVKDDPGDSREDLGNDAGAWLRGDGSGKSRGRTASIELELGAAIWHLNCDTTTCGCGTDCEREDDVDDVYAAGELDGWTTHGHATRGQLKRGRGNEARQALLQELRDDSARETRALERDESARAQEWKRETDATTAAMGSVDAAQK
ncbi:hypothetical protein C8R46DRAFT_1207239 [Mycena filopes]|nr:hypothetical protein C8R46DRAFT_1207239 [Mycena filopes]